MTKQYLDKSGLTYFYGKVKDKFVEKESGKGLSTNDYTTNEKNKLSGITAGAEVNTIETVKVNGTALVPDANKAVDIIISGGSVNEVLIPSLYDAGNPITINLDNLEKNKVYYMFDSKTFSKTTPSTSCTMNLQATCSNNVQYTYTLYPNTKDLIAPMMLVVIKDINERTDGECFAILTFTQSNGAMCTYRLAFDLSTPGITITDLAAMQIGSRISGFDASKTQFLSHNSSGTLQWITLPAADQNTLGGVKAYVDGNGDLQISTQ